MFSISSSVENRLIRFRGRGLWDKPTQERFNAAILAEVAKFNALGIPVDILGDLGDLPPQLKEVASDGPALAGQILGMGARRGAIVVDNAITKMQVARLTQASNALRFFSSEEEALAWLAEPVPA